MAANFEVKFIVDRVSANYKIRITDTSTGFSLVKANTKITFPDGYVLENTDVSNPDISSAGGYVEKNVRLDVVNKIVTGDYTINFTGYDASDNEYTSQKQFNFTWSEPSIVIQDLSDSGIPIVKFKDITTWDAGNFTESATTREFSVDYPSTSTLDGTNKSASQTDLSQVLEIDMINTGNYYEGVYPVGLNVDILYSHTNGYLTVQYKKNSSQDFPIKRTPSQTELLNKINQYKSNIDAYKTTNPTVYNKYAEDYDNVVALYSHAVSRYKLGIGDGAQDSIEELLDLIDDQTVHVYLSSPMTPFVIDETDFGVNQIVTKLEEQIGTFDADGNLLTIAKAFADEVFEVEATDFKAEASKLSTLLAQFGTYNAATDTFSFLATADYFEQVKTYADNDKASAVALNILFSQFGTYDPATETFTFSSTADYFNEVKTYADNDKASAQKLTTLTSQFGSYDPNTNTFTFDNTADYFEQVKTYADENSAAASKVSSLGSTFGSFNGNTFSTSEAKITEELNTYTGLNFSNSTYFQNIEADIESKPLVFRQAAEPAVTEPVGSIWYDTDDENKVYILVSGTPNVWTLTDDERIGASASKITSMSAKFGSFNGNDFTLNNTDSDYWNAVKLYADTNSAAATKIENLGAELVTFNPDNTVDSITLSSNFSSAIDTFVSDIANSALASKVEGLRVDIEGQDGTGGLTAQVTTNANVVAARPKIFRQDAEPSTTEPEGSLWFDTNDSNKAYVLVGDDGDPETFTWTVTRDEALISSVEDKPFIFRQDDAPATSNPEGSLWYDTNDGNKLYVLVSTTWTATQDSDIATAQATADGRPKVFRQDAEPATSEPEFSVWYDTDDNNLSYVLIGDGGDPETFTWTATVDGRVTDLLAFAEARYSLNVDANGVVTGLELYSASGPNTTVSTFKITADKFIVRESSTDFVPFTLDGSELKLDVPLNGVSGSFSGSLTAATGTFSGNVDGNIDGTAASTVKSNAADGATAKGITDDLTSVVAITSSDIAIVNTGETKTFNDDGTPFYVDNTGQFSLGDKLSYDPATNTLSITGAVTIESVSNLTKSDVGLGNVDNNSTATILAGNLTGTVNNVAVDTVTTGAAAGAAAKGITDNLVSVVDITSSDIAIVLDNETKTFYDDGTPFYVDNAGQFSLGDKLKYDPSTNTLSITGTVTIESVSGLDKSDVGLSNVDNNSTATILAGNLTGTVDGTAAGTVKSGAADGAIAKAETDKLNSVVSLTNSDIAIVNSGQTKTFYNAGTPFYVDNTGDFSLGDKLKYDNSENLLTISGAVTIESVSGLTKSDVGLGNVDNTSTADILDGTAGDFSGDVTGTVDGVSASTVKTGAADGTTAKGVTDDLTSTVSLTNTKIYQGTGTFNNANTGFYLDNNGNFSLKDKLSFNGTTLSVDGEITSTSGNIGGWEINSTEIKSPAISGVNRLEFSPTAGFIVNDDSNNTSLLVNYGGLSSLSSTTTGATFADVSNAEVTSWDETVQAGNTLIAIPASNERYIYSSNYLSASFANTPAGGSYSYEITVDAITGALATLSGSSSYLKAKGALHVQIATDTTFNTVIKDIELWVNEVTGNGATLTFPGLTKEISFSINDNIQSVYLRFYWYRFYAVAYSDSITWSPRTFNVSSADANDDLVFLIYNGTTELTNEGVQIINDPTTYFKVDRANFVSGNPYVDIGGDVRVDGDFTVTGNINIEGDVENSDVSVSNLRERLGEINSDFTIGASSSIDATFSGDVTVSGSLHGPATFYIDPSPDDTGQPGGATTDTGTVVILGDLQVTGQTTTVDSTVVSIADLNMTLASNASNASEANGAGLTIGGASATMTYNSSSDRFVFNKDIQTNLVGNVTGALTGNASTATSAATLTTTRNIAISGAVTGNADFDGSGDITITTSVNHNHDADYVNVTGDTMIGDLDFDDDAQAKFGTGDDMTIYHNGSHSFIRQVGTGNLYIDQASDGKNITFRNDDGSGGLENYFVIQGNAQKNVFHKNVDVTSGNLQIGGTTVIDSGREATFVNVSVDSGGSNGVRVHTNSGITASNNYLNFFTAQSSGWSFNANGTGADTDSVLTIDSSGNVNAVGQVLADGTLSNSVPALSFSGDSDTGLSRIADNSVGLIAGGSRKFYVNATTAYFQNLSGGVQITGSLTADGITLTDDIITSADFSAPSNRFKLVLTQADSSTIEASFDDVVLSSEMNANFVPYVTSAGGNGTTLNSVLGESWLKINSNTLELDWTIYDSNGDVSPGVYQERNIKMRKSGSFLNKYKEATYDADSITFLNYESASDIDIATISATTTGRIRINNSYSLPVSDGTNGYVLTTNGSGDLSWAAASGGDADTLDGRTLDGAFGIGQSLFNNQGRSHSSYTDFNDTGLRSGINYIQGATNSPTGATGSQWYGFRLGLGSDYGTATGSSGDYASELYWNRQSQGSDPYLWARDMESGTWGSWRKMSAGYADNAGTLNGVAGSNFLRSDQDDTATGKITINNNSNSINDPTLTISSSQGGGSFGRLMFNGTATVAGVINRGTANADLYFDETSDTGKYIFRSSGDATFVGNIGVGNGSPTNYSGYSTVHIGNASSIGLIKLGSGASADGPEIFSNTSKDIVFNTDGTNTRVVIDGGNGNVGINTTSPDYKLDVSGTFAFRGTGYAYDAYLYAYNSTAGTYFQFGNVDGDGYLDMGGGGDIIMQNNGGNVGIGTITPTVYGSGMEIKTGGQSGLRLASTTADGGIIEIGADSGQGYIQNVRIGDYTRFYVSNSSDADTLAMSIRPNGNIGIGNTAPAYTLDVNGTVRLGGNEASNKPIRMGYGNNAIYMGATNINTINVGYEQDSDDYNLHINYVGYASSNTRFRSLEVNNGKQELIAYFQGSTKRVGIGTNSPDSKLQITNADGSSYRFGYAGTSDVYIDARTTYFRTANGGSNTVTINADGDVGIGTTSPATKLDVNGAGTFVGNIALITDATSGNYSLIQHKYDGVAKAYSGYNSGFALYGGETDVATRIQSGGQYAITALTNGNVGIGTTSPSAKLNTNLSVEGTILAYQEGTTYTFDGDANIAVTHNSSTMGTGTAAGLLLANNNNSNNAISPLIAFSARSASNGYNHTYAAIYGQKRASGADSNWNRGDLIFATGESTGPRERMRIDDSGDVGIGTTSPSFQLHVNKSGNTGIFVSNTTGDTGGYLYAGALGGLEIQSVNSANSVAQKLLLQPYGGNVGIGITGTPSAKLHVAGSAFLSDDVYVGDSSSNLLFTTYSTVGGAYSGSFGWNSLQLGNNGGNFIMAGNNAAGGTLGIYTNVSSRYRYGVDQNIVGTLAAWFDANGNVGINTTSPGGTYGKLSVAGGIRILDDNNAKLEIGRYSSGASDSYIKMGSNSNSLRFTNNADTQDVFAIYNNGDVAMGVGTNQINPLLTNPGRGSLTVNGSSDSIVTLGMGGTWYGYYYVTTADLYLAHNGGNIQLQAGGSTKMHITSGGAVGIGTTSPSAMLDVRKNDSGVSMLIRNGDVNTGGNNEAQIQFGFNGTDDYSHFIRTRHNSADTGGNAIDFYTCDSTENNSITSGVRHNLTLDSGVVAINKTSGYATGGFGEPKFVIKQTQSSEWGGMLVEAAGNDAIFAFGTRDDGHYISGSYRTTAGYKPLYFSLAGSTRMTLNTSGNLCVGTTADDSYRMRVRTSSNLLAEFASSGTSTYVQVGDAGNNNYSNIGFVNNYGTAQLWHAGSTYGSNWGGNDSFNFYTPTASFHWHPGGNANRMTLSTAGVLSCANDIIAFASDKRLKENIRPIENAIDKIKQINGVHYRWKDEVEELGFSPTQKEEVGVIAQEVEKVIPEAVKPAPFDYHKGESKSGENYLTVQYEKLVPLLIEAIKDQQKQIDELKAKLNA